VPPKIPHLLPCQPAVQWVAVCVCVCVCVAAAFPEIKRSGYEADPSHPSHAVVKNTWNYTSTTLHFMTWRTRAALLWRLPALWFRPIVYSNKQATNRLSCNMARIELTLSSLGDLLIVVTVVNEECSCLDQGQHCKCKTWRLTTRLSTAQVL
jgi:hypothetical protein